MVETTYSLDHEISLRLSIAEHFYPRERLSLSEWAEKNVILSSEYAATAQAIRLYGWQKEIFDTFTDDHTNEITLCCGTQLTKTIFMQCALAFTIVEEPGPALIVQPTDEDAKSFSKERLGPMRRDCPSLHSVLPESERGGNTIQFKEFPGGSVAIVGARSPGNFARRSIRYVFFDEVDKYPLSAATSGSVDEGDPVILGEKRAMTFGNRRKIIKACSPTVKGRSRILKSYEDSDMRKPWVRCWKCGFAQVLNFRANVKFDSKLPANEAARSAFYECANPECRAKWNDYQRWRSVESVEWRAEKPFYGHAGFWISHLYSKHVRIEQLVSEFLRASRNPRPTMLQSFINTSLAEGWEDQGMTPDKDTLYNRREIYPHTDEAVVPMRALFLTAAVDVQDNPPRLECEVKGWGRDGENWSIGYWVIQVQTEEDGEFLPVTSPALWKELDELLRRQFDHESGSKMPIMVMCIDTGKTPKPVYNFTAAHNRLLFTKSGIRLHSPRTVVPIKGNDDPLKVISSVSKEDAARKRQNVRIVHIGTHRVKQEIFESMQFIKPDPSGEPVPGCYHWPNYMEDYFDGLSSEIRTVDEKGKVEYVKRPGIRNEPLDLAVYNRAAATIMGLDRFGEKEWRTLEQRLGVKQTVESEIEEVDDADNISKPQLARDQDELTELDDESGDNNGFAGITPPVQARGVDSTQKLRKKKAGRQVWGRFV